MVNTTWCALQGPRHDILDAYGGYIINLGSGLPYINTTADIELIVDALESCRAISGWYTGKELSMVYMDGACNSSSSGRSTAASSALLMCSQQSHVTGQLAVAQFQDNVYGRRLSSTASVLSPFQSQFYGAQHLTGVYFVEGKDPIQLSTRFNRDLVALDGFIGSDNLDLVNGTWLISSVGTSSESYLWLNLNQSLATANCLGEERLPNVVSSCRSSSSSPSVPLFVLPGVFSTAVNCTEGVYADQRYKWTQYLAAYRESYSSNYFGFPVRYDDANNIYTGAVGAFLGALALAAASLLYYILPGVLYCVLRCQRPQNSTA